ncbi:hypothetical protein DRN58_06570 [Thermococci archaeon]|nr:MAG: hypothetical protein DRN58_06570 [Thermococci archaeon]
MSKYISEFVNNIFHKKIKEYNENRSFRDHLILIFFKGEYHLLCIKRERGWKWNNGWKMKIYKIDEVIEV